MRPQSASRGHTLFELLGVVLIVAIIMMMATLSFRSRGPLDKIVEEGERLASLMRLASRDAVMRSRQLGVQVNDAGYRFVELHGDEWTASATDAFRHREFSESLSASLRIDGVPMIVEAPVRIEISESVQQNFAPQILFLSSGDITPFDLTLAHPETQTLVRLSSDWEDGVITERLAE